jgi:hypothetical protein
MAVVPYRHATEPEGFSAMMKSAFRLSLSCLGLGLLACKGDPELLPISSSRAALTASENSERALDGVLDAADFLSESTSLAQALGAMGGSSESCTSSGTACFSATGSCPEPEIVCTTDQLDESDLEETRANLRESAADLVQQLREKILIPANLESETDTSATYRLGPDVMCDADDAPTVGSSNGAPPSAPSYDPDCVDEANRVQLRLRLTSLAEGDVDVTVLVGKQRHEPIVFELHQHSLGVKVDLGEALAAARELGESADEIEQLSGVLELQLVENQARDYSLDLNVLEALKAVLHSDGDTVNASLGASSPAMQLRVDGNARRFLASTDLGALQVLGPLRMFADSFGSSSDDSTGVLYTGALSAPVPAPAPHVIQGALDMFLAGLEGSLEYVADSDELHLNGLGFGDKTSYIKNDGKTLLGLDLNAQQGRHVDLLLEPEGEGTKISISPGFDLKLALAFHQIADQVDGIADYLLNDTWHFWFDGAAPVLVAGDDQLQVQAGTLHLESAADPSANVSVSAGMCLAEADVATESDADDWRHRFDAAVCQ